MKLLSILIVSFAFGLSGCTPKRQLWVTTQEGNGWNTSTYTIRVDSVDMVTDKECYYWIDGRKSHLINTVPLKISTN